ncbi:translation factor GUF1, mitochondrial-like [Epinephelus moara]|uniref:translation factor GUF1, mitochondrial-like n=1 Tax=Epinephelus moara TaxID=300413 RepID=UPI00214DFF25|nr:translation factor GUF1, mitochondrial-like [Epinephelus moara]
MKKSFLLKMCALCPSGMYPMDQSEYVGLRSAIERLTLNDSSVTVQRDSSLALGAGWRLGFLNLLHMEVFNQRLEQEYSASVIVTAPTGCPLFTPTHQG